MFLLLSVLRGFPVSFRRLLFDDDDGHVGIRLHHPSLSISAGDDIDDGWTRFVQFFSNFSWKMNNTNSEGVHCLIYWTIRWALGVKLFNMPNDWKDWRLIKIIKWLMNATSIKLDLLPVHIPSSLRRTLSTPSLKLGHVKLFDHWRSSIFGLALFFHYLVADEQMNQKP